MHERRAEPFSAAEERLAGRLRRWTDHGVVAIDAADIALRAVATGRAGRTTADETARADRRVAHPSAVGVGGGLPQVPALAAVDLVRRET